MKNLDANFVKMNGPKIFDIDENSIGFLLVLSIAHRVISAVNRKRENTDFNYLELVCADPSLLQQSFKWTSLLLKLLSTSSPIHRNFKETVINKCTYSFILCKYRFSGIKFT